MASYAQSSDVMSDAGSSVISGINSGAGGGGNWAEGSGRYGSNGNTPYMGGMGMGMGMGRGTAPLRRAASVASSSNSRASRPSRRRFGGGSSSVRGGLEQRPPPLTTQAGGGGAGGEGGYPVIFPGGAGGGGPAAAPVALTAQVRASVRAFVHDNIYFCCCCTGVWPAGTYKCVFFFFFVVLGMVWMFVVCCRCAHDTCPVFATYIRVCSFVSPHSIIHCSIPCIMLTHACTRR